MKRILVSLLLIWGMPVYVFAQEAQGKQQSAPAGGEAQGKQQSAPAGGEEQPAPAGGGGEVSEEETVVGTAEYKIDDAIKPIVDLQLKPFEPVDSFILIKEKGLEKRLPAGIDEELSEVVKLNNPFLRRPVYPVMIVDKMVINLRKYPKPDNWKIVIYNSAGIPVKTFEGRGGLPKEIEWNGVSDKGLPVIKPGERFTYRVYLERKSGAKRREVEEVPEIVGFSISDPKGDNLVYLNTDYIFQPGRANLQPDGEERIMVPVPNTKG